MRRPTITRMTKALLSSGQEVIKATTGFVRPAVSQIFRRITRCGREKRRRSRRSLIGFLRGGRGGFLRACW